MIADVTPESFWGQILTYTHARPAEVVSLARGRLVYLASPYSRVVTDDGGGFDPGLSFRAGFQAALWSTRLASVGVTAVSPIVLSSAMVGADARDVLDPLDAAFWTRWCEPLLRACDVLIVAPIPGWQDSDGCHHEVSWAVANGRPALLLDPEAWA